MKARLIDTHLLVPGSSVKFKVKYQGHVSQKMGVSGALVFHKHHLFYNIFLSFDRKSLYFGYLSFNLLSANAFNYKGSKILLFSNELKR